MNRAPAMSAIDVLNKAADQLGRLALATPDIPLEGMNRLAATAVAGLVVSWAGRMGNAKTERQVFDAMHAIELEMRELTKVLLGVK